MRFNNLKKYLPGYADGGEVQPEDQGYIQPEQQQVGYGTMIPAAQEALRNVPRAALDTGIAAFKMSSPMSYALDTAGNPNAQGDMLGQISHIPGSMAAGPLVGKLGQVAEQASPEVSALEQLSGQNTTKLLTPILDKSTLGTPFETENLKQIPMDQIEHQEPWSPERMNDNLSKIQESNQTYPIRVVKDLKTGKYKIDDGIHRYNAAKQLGHTKIPAFTEE